jgi:molecular chaperone IbpA
MTSIPTYDHVRTLSVGFDSIFDSLMSNVSSSGSTYGNNYPPYNLIKKSDEHFVIELAVAGFEKEDIEIETKESKISIRSIIAKRIDEENSKEEYLHKGISKRAFNRTFTLSSDVFVKSASMVNGLLKIDLERIIPDMKKSRVISIN